MMNKNTSRDEGKTHKGGVYNRPEGNPPTSIGGLGKSKRAKQEKDLLWWKERAIDMALAINDMDSVRVVDGSVKEVLKCKETTAYIKEQKRLGNWVGESN